MHHLKVQLFLQQTGALEILTEFRKKKQIDYLRDNFDIVDKSSFLRQFWPVRKKWLESKIKMSFKCSSQAVTHSSTVKSELTTTGL